MPRAMRPAYAPGIADPDARRSCTDGRTDGLTNVVVLHDVNLKAVDAGEIHP